MPPLVLGLTLLATAACSLQSLSDVQHLAAEAAPPTRPAWYSFADPSAKVEPCADPAYFEAGPKSLPALLESLPDCSVVTLRPGHYAEMMPY
ncbi:MAG TPA: hypothetical protein VK035_09150, partial [Kiloniellales bacterium]|nr:hypothetical protein [Kiloniellales bacterium]